jgi:hypothetical protein
MRVYFIPVESVRMYFPFADELRHPVRELCPAVGDEVVGELLGEVFCAKTQAPLKSIIPK